MVVNLMKINQRKRNLEEVKGEIGEEGSGVKSPWD